MQEYLDDLAMENLAFETCIDSKIVEEMLILP
jgi:hypothetical protein